MSEPEYRQFVGTERLRIMTGGPVFQYQRDERSMKSIIELACFCQHSAKFNYVGHDGFHTSNLWSGRAHWLRSQIKDAELDLAIAIDADVAFRSAMLLAELGRVAFANDVAIGIAPVRIGGTVKRANINVDIGNHHTPVRADGLMELLKSENREIDSGGFGLAVFNLGWYRAHWPLPKPEYIDENIGEDIEHCHAVRKRGGKVIALAVVTEHYAFGEKQTK